MWDEIKTVQYGKQKSCTQTKQNRHFLHHFHGQEGVQNQFSLQVVSFANFFFLTKWFLAAYFNNCSFVLYGNATLWKRKQNEISVYLKGLCSGFFYFSFSLEVRPHKRYSKMIVHYCNLINNFVYIHFSEVQPCAGMAASTVEVWAECSGAALMRFS